MVNQLVLTVVASLLGGGLLTAIVEFVRAISEIKAKDKSAGIEERMAEQEIAKVSQEIAYNAMASCQEQLEDAESRARQFDLQLQECLKREENNE